MIDLAHTVEEEMEWTVEIENREACEDLMETVEKFEKASRKEKADQMKYAFQLGHRTDILDQGGKSQILIHRLCTIRI